MNARVRLRTKLLLSLIVTTAVLSGASLLVVQTYVGNRLRHEIDGQIVNSLRGLEQYLQQQHRLHLNSTATSALLPTLRQLMTISDEVTIQDGSLEMWRSTGGDLFVLADPEGRIMALHSSTEAFDREIARASLRETLQHQRSRDWWLERGHLYEVFIEPIYLGDPQDTAYLGALVTGIAIDERFASILARVASSEVAFRFGKVVVASSLPADRERDLAAAEVPWGEGKLIHLGGEAFVAQSVGLTPEGREPVTLTVLRSYNAATLLLQNVNRLLLAIGLVVLIAGSLLMFVISYTLTRPLSRLAAGVVALEKGDYSYPLQLHGKDEVGELTNAFDTMRKSLKQSQKELLQAERLATIGRMASTVSHDLRHPLTTILAYAELLSESKLDDKERIEMYQQIRLSVNNMADLIASLLEFSKAQEALQFAYGDCVETLQDTIRAVKMRPEFRRIQMTLVHEGPTQGWFDFAKLDRVFSNLLRNACEAVAPDSGRIGIVARGTGSRVEVSVSDNGSGIPERIRDEVFQPFFTYGKSEGTGLGLAVVKKIVLDHGGEVVVESTGSNGTTFKVILPLAAPATHRVQSSL